MLTDDESLPAEFQPLAARFDLKTTSIELAGHRWRFVHPRSVDDLISEDDFQHDDRLPYWANIWPSARVLAAHVAKLDGHGRRLLELGCGAGLVALAAASAGFEVLASDYYAEAVEFTAANARLNGIDRVETRVVDWRDYPADLVDFDYVVAADVLYERTNPPLVADVYRRSLAKGGVGLLTDPGRSVAKPFAKECRKQGLSCDCIDLEQVIDGTINCVVETFELRFASANL